MKEFANLHYRTRVGNGSSSFLNSNWFGTGPLVSFNSLSDMTNLSLRDVYVNGEWQMDLVHLQLPPEVQQMIKDSSFQFSDVPDAQIWDLTDSGVFSIASAYHGLRHKQSEVQFSRWIWRPGLPLKCSILLWRIINGILPFDDVLMHMGFSLASKCPFCPAADSISHCFFECSLARSVWEHLSILLDFHVSSHDLKGFHFSIWNHRDPSSQIVNILPTVVCWSIWKVRNSFIHEGRISTSNQVVASSWLLLQEVTSLNPPLVSRNVVVGLAWSNLLLRCRFKVPIAIHWFCPVSGLKLNVDGSSRGNPGQAGGGFVVRDSSGWVILAESKYFGHATSLEAEALALLNGLQAC